MERGLRIGIYIRQRWHGRLAREPTHKMRVSRLHSEFFAEIQTPHLRVLGQRARRARAKYFSLSHDIGAVGHAEGFAHIMISNQDPDAAAAQVDEYTLNIVAGLGIDSGKRFVQENELRLSRQRASNFSTPAFASGQGIAAGVAHVFDAELLKQLFDAFALLSAAQSGGL